VSKKQVAFGFEEGDGRAVTVWAFAKPWGAHAMLVGLPVPDAVGNTTLNHEEARALWSALGQALESMKEIDAALAQEGPF
jgi:hypothetical protein